MSRTGLQISRSTYATRSWNVKASTAQDRMSRRDRLEWCNLYSYNLDTDERSPELTHPARVPKVGGKRLLQRLPSKVKNKIYAYLAENIHVVGISSSDEHGEGGFTCVHPLAYIKPFRSEFLDWIRKHRLPKITTYIARIENFDFERLMKTVKQHEHFGKGLGNISIHIYLDMTETDFDITKVLEWAGDKEFARSNYKDFHIRYAVGNMPAPEHRDKLVRELFWFHRTNYGEHPFLSPIAMDIRKWWMDGLGVDDWTVDADMDDSDYDPEEVAEETASDFQYDHDLDDDGDVVIEDPRNHDDILKFRKELAYSMDMDEHICDPDEMEHSAREDATRAQQDRQSLKLVSKQYDNIYKCFGPRSNRHRFADNSYLDD